MSNRGEPPYAITLKARTAYALIERELAYYDERAHGLCEVLADGAASTIEQVRSWHPAFVQASDEVIRSAARAGSFTLDDARLVYAREHGFSSWEHLAEHLLGFAARIDVGVVEQGDAVGQRRFDQPLRVAALYQGDRRGVPRPAQVHAAIADAGRAEAIGQGIGLHRRRAHWRI